MQRASMNTPITPPSIPSVFQSSSPPYIRPLCSLSLQGGGKPIPFEVDINNTLFDILQKVASLTGIAQNLQLVSITTSESEQPNLATMTVEEREKVQSDTEALIPEDVLAAAKEHNTLVGSDVELKDLRPGHIVRYLKTGVRQWDEERVLQEAEAAGPWGDTNLDFLGDGGNLYDLTVGDDTSYVKGGFAGSEFGTEDPPAPEATVQAIVARVEQSIVESEAVIVPVFGAVVRLLKIKADISKQNKADERKKPREARAAMGRHVMYVASHGDATVCLM